MSDSTGVGTLRYPAMGVVFNDLDRDGDLDLYVANDTEPNLLWRNDGDWRLVQVAVQAGAAYSGDGLPQASMGLHAGDFDRATAISISLQRTFQKSSTPCTATREFGASGIVRARSAWAKLRSPTWDGERPLSISTGTAGSTYLSPTGTSIRNWIRATPICATRSAICSTATRGGRFREVGEQSGAVWKLQKVSRAAAVGDYDNDGDVDVFIMNLNDTPTLLRNDSEADHRWLGLRLVGAEGRIAIGAEVRVRAGGSEQVREVHRGYSFQAQNDPALVVRPRAGSGGTGGNPLAFWAAAGFVESADWALCGGGGAALIPNFNPRARAGRVEFGELLLQRCAPDRRIPLCSGRPIH